jgi:hypothetical protein
MSSPPLSDDVLRETLALIEKHGGVAQAAAVLGMPYGTFQGRARNARNAQKHGRLGRIDVEMVEDRQAIPKGMPFEREWRIWLNEIGCAKDRYAGPAKPKARAGRLKILVVPDLHAPFHDKTAVASMLARERDIDVCVLMGDIGDSYSLSRFLKYDPIPYDVELASVTALLQTFSEAYPIVRIIEGNHDGPRLEKQLLDKLSKDMVLAIRAMTGGTLDPMEVLCRRFGNIERVSPSTSNGHAAKWMTQIGDVVFTHAEKFSRVPGSALRSIEDWMSDFDQALGLKDWNVLIQAHTHQLGWFPFRANKLLIECGCLCSPAGYQFTPKIGGRPQRNGWITLEQVDGKTDINSIRIVWFDTERPTETEVAHGDARR